MKSYTNSKGEYVSVSAEHLETAIRIKDELQKLSPSMRCNWKTHRKMMVEEGFTDSDSNEQYRCLIKYYQSKMGKIIPKEKHVDLLSEKKLTSIKNAVGELAYNKREVQLESQKLGKLKRELTLWGVVAEEISDAVNTHLSDVSFDKMLYKKSTKDASSMLVVLSDWHIGAVVDDVYGNSYNYEIAKERLVEYYSKIVDTAKNNNVTNIIVSCLGDMTEHISMRKVNQAFESEFTMSEQITKAYDLIKSLLISLSLEFNVSYCGISGNHDRMNGSKDDNIDGDSTMSIINYFLKETINKINEEEESKLSYIESDNINYSAKIEVNGVKVKLVHGDNERSGEGRILSSHSALDGVIYDLVVMGHIHHFKVKEVGQNRFEVHSGSPMGMNNYAVKGKFSSSPSQTVILIDSDGKIDIRRISLN